MRKREREETNTQRLRGLKEKLLPFTLLLLPLLVALTLLLLLPLLVALTLLLLQEDGGALELFDVDAAGQPRDVVQSLVPQWNSFAFFEVTPTSFHQVRELGKKREEEEKKREEKREEERKRGKKRSEERDEEKKQREKMKRRRRKRRHRREKKRRKRWQTTVTKALKAAEKRYLNVFLIAGC